MWSEFPGHVRRFFRGFSRALSPSEVAHARRLLTPAELLLFAGLPGRERRHAMDMLHWLRARAAPSDELLAAALVHNVGKGPIHLQERVAYVLLDLLTPDLLERIASPSGVRFQRSLAAQRDHPRRGAALLERSRLNATRAGARTRAPRPAARGRPRAGLADRRRHGLLT